MKDPAFLFYPNDFMGGTLGMTFEQKGAYLEILIVQFNRGHLTSDMIGHVLGQKVDELWNTIKDKFIQDENGLFYNERLEIEQNKRKHYTKTRRNNLKGTNQYTKKGHTGGHLTSNMENRNENENSNVIIDKEKEKGLGKEKEEEGQ